MSKLRKYAFKTICITSILISVIFAIYPDLEDVDNSNFEIQEDISKNLINNNFLETNAKIIFALNEYLKNGKNNDLIKNITEEKLDNLFETNYIEKKIILNIHLNKETDDLVRSLKTEETNKYILSYINDEQIELTNNEILKLEEQYSWFANLLISKISNDIKTKDKYLDKATLSSQKTLKKLTSIVSIFGLLLLTGTISIIILIYKSIKGTFKLNFIANIEYQELMLEVFSLYMLWMLIFPHILKKLINPELIGEYALEINLVGISASFLILLWPRISWAKETDITKAINLKTTDNFIKEAALGMISYATLIIPLFLFMIIYGIILQNLGIEQSSGAHPIVPILLAKSNPKTFWMIAFLAIVLAPITEEIMFRGAFYGYLRSFLGKFASIVISSLVFASIHPQGLVGIIPLAIIGAALAFIREWRGNLIAPMFCHACVNGITLLMVSTLTS